MTEVELKEKADSIIKKVKYGGVAVVALIIAPFLFFSTMMLAGSVVAAGVAALGAIGLVNYLPVFSMKMANWKMKGLKAEARKNPIETMENQLLKATEQLDRYKEETKSFISKAKALEDDVKEMRATDPEGADSFADHIKANAQQAQMREQAIRAAVEKIETARIKLTKARKRWEMTQKHQATLNMSEKESALDQILIDEAMDQVMSEANRATSNLIVESMVDSARTDFKNKRNEDNAAYRQGKAAQQAIANDHATEPFLIDIDSTPINVPVRNTKD